MKLIATLGAALLGTALFAGCSSTHAVSASATPVAEGNGSVTYTTAAPGHLYVYDKTWNKLVYSGYVGANQTVAVDTGGNRILVDGRPVVEGVNLGHGDRYQMLLDRNDLSGGRTTTVERRTVIERDVR